MHTVPGTRSVVMTCQTVIGWVTVAADTLSSQSVPLGQEVPLNYTKANRIFIEIHFL